ncbi:MAG: VWA domain-containing protein, partial [Thermoplasmata archaeon]|nr:VWA domain-containing protein [Thermoplasmata archaeon]
SGYLVNLTMNRTGSNVPLLPSQPQGNYDMFIAVSTSSSVGNRDRFFTTIPSFGIEIFGKDNTTSRLLLSSNRSRDIMADTLPPDLSTCTLTITSDDPTYFHSEDTDLSGTDRVFYNSIPLQGQGQRVTVRFSGFTEDNPYRLIGEAAFNRRPSGPIDFTRSTTQSVSYAITSGNDASSPLTFTLQDELGHSTSWDVNFVEDNSPPDVSDIVMGDDSLYMDTVLSQGEIYFRPVMFITEHFWISGSSSEPAGGSGLDRVEFEYEPSLASGPTTDLTPATWNGSYGVDNRSEAVDSPLRIMVHDNVGNQRVLVYDYIRVNTNPTVTFINPSTTGMNVSGVFPVAVQASADAPLGGVEFSSDQGASYQKMVRQGSYYRYDWDTLSELEGPRALRVRASDTVSGVEYDVSWVIVDNYPLYGWFVSPTYDQHIRGIASVRLSVSSFCNGARIYLGNTFMGSISGSPTGGEFVIDINTDTIPDGSYTLTAVLSGFAGDRKNITIPVTVDNTAPTISYVFVDHPGAQEASKPGDGVRVKATVFDNTSTISTVTAYAGNIGGNFTEMMYDDGGHDDGFSADGHYSTSSFLVDAIWAFHVVLVEAVDEAGNTATFSIMSAVDPNLPVVEESWIEHPNGQGAAKPGDEIQIIARASDLTSPIYVTLVLDDSGSMSRDGKMDELKKAAKQFVNTTRSIDHLAIYTFSYYYDIPPYRPKRILNFTLMDLTGKASAISLIDGLIPQSATPIWDTVGEAVDYTQEFGRSSPVVVAFTDGADDRTSTNTYFEEGSEDYCPWFNWGTTQWVSSHLGKYPDEETGNNIWVDNPVNEFRGGLLYSPIPIYTIGLGLEHFDPPNRPQRATRPANGTVDNTNAYWDQESGTTEYNLWRMATTSGGQYRYAPSGTQLEMIFRNLADSIFEGDSPSGIHEVSSYVPMDTVTKYPMYDDGLHSDGLPGDGIYATDRIHIPTMDSHEDTVIVECTDWAGNIGYDYVNITVDSDLPVVNNITVVYPDNRSSVGDGEEFWIEIGLEDEESGIWRVEADGEAVGYLPPVIFNDTGLGNDVLAGNMIYTCSNITPTTGNAPSRYFFVNVSIRDLAGNLVRYRAQVFVVNDRLAPKVEMVSPLQGEYLSMQDRVKALVTDDGDITVVRYVVSNGDGRVRSGLLFPNKVGVYESDIDVGGLPDGFYFIEVYALDSADRNGSSGVLDVGIDNSFPSLLVSYPVNNSAISNVVSVVAVSNDFPFTAEISFSIDKGPFVPMDSLIDTMLFPQGRHTITVRAVDPSGKITQEVLVVYFDNSIPDVTLLHPTTGTIVGGNIDIQARVTDGGGIYTVEAAVYLWGNRTDPTPPSLNETPIATLALTGPSDTVVLAGLYHGVIDSLGLQDGRYLLYLLVRDRSGAENFDAVYLPVDNNGPDLKVVHPPDGAVISGVLSPDLILVEPFLSESYYTFLGESYQFGQDLDLSDTPEGEYLVRFVAMDTSFRTAVVERTLYIDNSEPDVKLLSPSPDSVLEGRLEVLVRVLESSGVRYVTLLIDGYEVALGQQLEGGSIYSFSYDLSKVNRSAHVLTVRAENRAGLVGYSRSIPFINGFIDTDGDGVRDIYDDDPFNASVHGDYDGDGFGSYYDDDDDGDGYLDEVDMFPYDDKEWLDTDGDGIGNTRDGDDDNDGVVDGEDAFPTDNAEWLDSDGDGIGDNADTDDDGDGWSDADELDCQSDSMDGADAPTDTDGDWECDLLDDDDDGDGAPDEADLFPLDPSEWDDSDADGVG